MSGNEPDPELAAIRQRMVDEIQGQIEERHQAPAATDAPDAPVDVDDATFDRFVLQHGTVLVDLWAPWCGPCRYVGPILEELAAERKGLLVVAKVNVDHNPRISQRFQVQGIPTLLLFKGGRLVNRLTGALPKPQLETWLARSGA